MEENNKAFDILWKVKYNFVKGQTFSDEWTQSMKS